MVWYTATGDEGYTSLIGGERVQKCSPRIEALGELDEAMAALGCARAAACCAESKALLLRIQRELSLLMAEVAMPEPEKLRQRIDAATVAVLEADVARFAEQVDMTQGFIVPGDTLGGAALHLARSVVRRAERRVVDLLLQGLIVNAHLVRYLNRLSSLLFLLARVDDKTAGVGAPTQM